MKEHRVGRKGVEPAVLRGLVEDSQVRGAEEGDELAWWEGGSEVEEAVVGQL